VECCHANAFKCTLATRHERLRFGSCTQENQRNDIEHKGRSFSYPQASRKRKETIYDAVDEAYCPAYSLLRAASSKAISSRSCCSNFDAHVSHLLSQPMTTEATKDCRSNGKYAYTCPLLLGSLMLATEWKIISSCHQSPHPS
jgi:hypothetical protein